MESSENPEQPDAGALRWDDPLDLHTVSSGMKSWLNVYAGLGVTMIPSLPAASQENAAESDDSPGQLDLANSFLDEVYREESAEWDWFWHQKIRSASGPSEGQRERKVQASTSKDTPQKVSDNQSSSNEATDTFGRKKKPSPAPATKSQPSSTGSSGGRWMGDRRSGESAGTVDDGPDLETFPDLSDQERTEKLVLIDQEVKSCQMCPELVSHRSQTVFGQGPVRPRLLFMGEAPGADEDRQGQPMVGAAGQLLNKIIGAMKMKREDVYVLNTIKCRPPRNRNPLETECGHCRHFWRRQIEVLKPDCIVCLGAVAAKTLLQTTLPVGRMRGKMHNYRGVPVAVTYHPAYLLRTASAKRQTWEDMQKVMTLLGIPIK